MWEYLIPIHEYIQDCILFQTQLFECQNFMAYSITIQLGSTGNRSSKPASTPASDGKCSSVGFETCPITWRPASCRSESRLVSVNPWVAPDLARTIRSNLRVYISGGSIYGRIGISYCWSHNINDRTSLLFLDVLAAFIIKQWRDTLSDPTWKWVWMEHQWYAVSLCGQFEWRVVVNSQKWGLRCLHSQKRNWLTRCNWEFISVSANPSS